MNSRTTLEDNSSKNISAKDSLLIKLKNIIDDYSIESDGCEEGFTLDAILKDILQRQTTALQKFKKCLNKYSTAKDAIFTRENIINFINFLRGTGKTTRVLKQINLENQFNEDLPVLLTVNVDSVESLLKNDTFDYDGFEYKEEPTNVNVVDFRIFLGRKLKNQIQEFTLIHAVMNT